MHRDGRDQHLGAECRQSVIVIGLRGANASFVTGVAHGISKDPGGGRPARLAQDLKASEPGVDPGRVDFSRRAWRAMGRLFCAACKRGCRRSIPVVGGSAGDDFYFQRTFQYFDDDILTDSVPGALLCGEIEVGIGVRHGWVPLGRPRCITKSVGDVIYQLDGKPAVAIYEQYLGTKPQGHGAQRSMAQLAMNYPLGIHLQENEEKALRSALQHGENAGLWFVLANVRREAGSAS